MAGRGVVIKRGRWNIYKYSFERWGLNVQGVDAQAKINDFYQLALLSNNLVLISY